MSEGVYNIVAFGRQASLATAVAATTVFPVDAGFLGFELDRATESPDEDYGSTSREQAGRTSHGIRWATASLPFVARFEDIMHPLEMHVSTISGGTATGSAYTWTFDETSASLATGLKPYTIEYGVDGSTQDEHRAVGVIADTLELGFDALSAPGNSMWKGTLGLVAINREGTAITGTANPPTTLETMEGHRTTLVEGTTSTAFGSLANSLSLKQFSFRSSNSAVGRAYGGSSDTVSDIGRSGKGTIEFDALIGIDSTSKTNVHDVFNVSGSVASERRWRVTVTGSGSPAKVFRIDMRVSIRAVPLGDHEGEHLYAVSGVAVKDSTLGGRAQLYLAYNGVYTIP